MSITKIVRIGAAIFFVGLTGCESVSLIKLNDTFLTLHRQQSEMASLSQSQVLGELDQEAMRVGIQTQFAENGDEAMKSANNVAKVTKSATTKAERIQSSRKEVSFLSVAVRSYLASGPIADYKMVEPANRGKEVCKGLVGLDNLPTTCGYFHIAEFVGINNENLRAIRGIMAKSENLNSNTRLTPEEGKKLMTSFNHLIDALKNITDAETGVAIDWNLTAAGLKTHYERQRIKILCNVLTIQTAIPDVRPSEDFNRDQVEQDAIKKTNEWKGKLPRFDFATSCS